MSELRDRNDAGDAPSLEPADRSSTPESTDELFSPSSDRQRRRAVAWIGEADEPVALAALASAVAGPEGGPDRVRTALTRNDLPELGGADAVAVEFDRDRGRDRGVVVPGDRLGTLLEVLDVVAGMR